MARQMKSIRCPQLCSPIQVQYTLIQHVCRYQTLHKIYIVKVSKSLSFTLISRFPHVKYKRHDLIWGMKFISSLFIFNPNHLVVYINCSRNLRYYSRPINGLSKCPYNILGWSSQKYRSLNVDLSQILKYQSL